MAPAKSAPAAPPRPAVAARASCSGGTRAGAKSVCLALAGNLYLPRQGEGAATRYVGVKAADTPWQFIPESTAEEKPNDAEKDAHVAAKDAEKNPPSVVVNATNIKKLPEKIKDAAKDPLSAEEEINILKKINCSLTSPGCFFL